MKCVIESSQGVAFAACCWYLAEATPVDSATLVVVNPRSVHGRVLTLADDAGVVAVGDKFVEYAVERGPVCSTDGKPDRFRSLTLVGDECLVRDFVTDAVRAYRDLVLRRDVPDDAQKTYGWDPEGGEWVRGGSRRPRPMSTMYLSPACDDAARDFRRFTGSAVLEAMHIPCSRAYAFHGVPGSGKSSLVRALASDAGLGVAVLGYWPGMTDADVRDALDSVPAGCVACLEDVDTLIKSASSSMSAAGMLAALDALDARTEPLAVFFTTNRLDDLDPALRRRFDVVVDFTWASRAQAERMVAALIPEACFQDFWAWARSRTFPMSVLQKFLVRCLLSGDPATAMRDRDAFDALAGMIGSPGGHPGHPGAGMYG